jgi:hypothetical protein
MKRDSDREFFRVGESLFIGNMVMGVALAVCLGALAVLTAMWLRFDLSWILVVEMLSVSGMGIYLSIDSWRHLRDHRRRYGHLYRS